MSRGRIMRISLVAVAFAAGVVVGGLVVYVPQSAVVRSANDRTDELEAKYKKLEAEFQPFKAGWEPFEKKLRESKEREDALTEQLESKDRELHALRAENEKLKSATLQKSAGAVASKPAEESGKEEEAASDEEAKKVEALEAMISQFEGTPSDRKLMNEILGEIWDLKDPEAIKSLVDRLESILTKALENEPENPDLLFNRGNAYGAEMAYLQVKLKENPMVYGPKMGEVAVKAIGCFSRVVEKDPKDNEALLMRGMWCYHNPGTAEQACRDFVELVRRAKEQGFEQETGEQAFSGLAITYQKMGKADEAKKAVEEGLNLYPQSERLRKLQQQLR